MRKYEVIFIIKPVDEDTINSTIAKFENIVKNNGGNIDKVDRWGKKRLAYPVKDINEGFYCLFYITAEPKVVTELDRVMKITDEILKHMIVKEDE
ncbi:30S ribosomal protein S6 [Dendrosporobacter sp. 1207_IL3150]|uniref:30S ribosomal protein S6 n=1 Tax=Dendrosporobacter sp. 1207_IL3150 TaxID=3084054 RepID=UPI002FD9F794